MSEINSEDCDEALSWIISYQYYILPKSFLQHNILVRPNDYVRLPLPSLKYLPFNVDQDTLA